MKNPFQKVLFFLTKKKRLSVEVYFNQIKNKYSKEIDNQLKLVNDTIKRVKDFEKDTKIDGPAKEDYINNLSSEFVNNPTELGVFKAKNDLASKLRENLIYSEKAKNIGKDLKWLVDENNGLKSLDVKLDRYVRAFEYVKGKYTKGEIDASYNAHLLELKRKVFQFKNGLSTQEFNLNDVSDLKRNVMNSYYDILNSTPLPEVQKSITSPGFNFSELSVEGTNHPFFYDPYIIQKPLDIEVSIEKAHTQFEKEKGNRKIETNKNGEKKELRFNDVVDVRKIPNEGNIDYYLPSRRDGEIMVSDEIWDKIEGYKILKDDLKSFKHVQHDFKDESVLDDNSVNTNTKNADSIDENQDGTMKLSDELSSSNLLKPMELRNVTIHSSEYIDDTVDIPERNIQFPITNEWSIDFDKFMNNPSLGNNNDRLLLANINRMGESITYNKIDQTTGKKEEVTVNSINLMTYEKHEKLLNIKQKARENEYDGKKRKIKL